MRLVREQGLEVLTLEAVALQAGVSKGGLLYHFPSKDALLAGMAHYLIEEFEQAVEAAAAQDTDISPGRWLRAYVRVTFAECVSNDTLLQGLIALAAENPALSVPKGEAFRRWQERAEGDGLEKQRATIVRYAADGFWLADWLGVAEKEGAEREALRDALLALLKTEEEK